MHVPDRSAARSPAPREWWEGAGGPNGAWTSPPSRMCDRNGGRRLRQWLIEQIDSELYPGLIWENEEKTMFRIPWKHAGKQDYNQEVDASIFKVRTDG